MKILTIVICFCPSNKKWPSSRSELSKSVSQPSSPSTKQVTFSQPSEKPESNSPSKDHSSSRKTPKHEQRPSSKGIEKPTNSSTKRSAKKRVKRKTPVLKSYPASKDKNNSDPSPWAKKVEYPTDHQKDTRASCNPCCSQPPEVDLEKLNRLFREKKASERANHLLAWKKEDRERAKRVGERCKSSLGLYSIRDLGKNVGQGLDALIWARPEVMVYSFHPTKRLSLATAYAKRPKLHWNMQNPIPEDETLWRNSLRAYHKIMKKTSAHHYNKHVGRDPKEGHSMRTGKEGSIAKQGRHGLTFDHQGKTTKLDTPKDQLNRQQRNARTNKYKDTGILYVGNFYPSERHVSPLSSQSQIWYQRRQASEKPWSPRSQVSDKSSNSQSPRNSQQSGTKKKIRKSSTDGKWRQSGEKPLAKKVIHRVPEHGGTPDITVRKLYLVSDTANGKGKIRWSPKAKAQKDPEAFGDSSDTDTAPKTISQQEWDEQDLSTLKKEIPSAYSKSMDANSDNSPENSNSKVTDELLPYDLDEVATQLTNEPVIVMKVESSALGPINIMINGTFGDGEFTGQDDGKSQESEGNNLAENKEREDREPLDKSSSKSSDDTELLYRTKADAKAEPSGQQLSVPTDLFTDESLDPLFTSAINYTDDELYHVESTETADSVTNHSSARLSTVTAAEDEPQHLQSSTTADFAEDHNLDVPAVVTTVDTNDESSHLQPNPTADLGMDHKLESLFDLLDTIIKADIKDESENLQSTSSIAKLDADLDVHGTVTTVDTTDESHQLQSSRTADFDTGQSLDLHDTAPADHLQSCVTADITADHSLDLLPTVSVAKTVDEPHHLQTNLTDDLVAEHSLDPPITMADTKDESHNLHFNVTADLAHTQNLVPVSTVTAVHTEYGPPQMHPSAKVDLSVDHTSDVLATVTADTGKGDKSSLQKDKLDENLRKDAPSNQGKHHRRSFSEGSCSSFANSRSCEKPGTEPVQPLTFSSKKLRMRDVSSQVDFHEESVSFRQERVPSTSDKDEQTQTSSGNSDQGAEDLVSQEYVRPLARVSLNDNGIPFSKPGLYQVLEPPADAAGGKILATSMIRSASITGENSQLASPTNPVSPSNKHSHDASPSLERTVSFEDDIFDMEDIKDNVSTSKENSDTSEHVYLRHGRSHRRSRVIVRSSLLLGGIKDFGPGKKPVRSSRILDGIEDGLPEANGGRRRSSKVRIHSFLNSMAQRSRSMELKDLILQELKRKNPNLLELSYSDSEDRRSISSLSAISSDSSYGGNLQPGTPISDLSRISSSTSELSTFTVRKASATEATESTDILSTRGKINPNLNHRNNSGSQNKQQVVENSAMSAVSSVPDSFNKSVFTNSMKREEEGNRSTFSSVSGDDSGSGRTQIRRQSRVIMRSSIEFGAIKDYGPGKRPVRSSRILDLSGIDDPGLEQFKRKRSSKVRVHSFLRSTTQRARSVELNNLILRELAKDPALRDRITLQSDAERSSNHSSRSSSINYGSPASPSDSLASVDQESRTSGSVTLDAETFASHILSLDTRIQQTQPFHSRAEEDSDRQHTVGEQGQEVTELKHQTNGVLIAKLTSSSTSGKSGDNEDHRMKSDTTSSMETTSQADGDQSGGLMSNTASAITITSQTDDRKDGDAFNSSDPIITCLYSTDEHESLPLSPHQIVASSEQCSEPKLPQWMEKWKSDRFADFPPAPLTSVSRNEGVDSPPPTPADGPPSTPPHQIEFLQAFWNKNT
ncbi:hypothetical protein R1flu_007715 [Riccia fluitans]|uniref:Uncharacterized protein n=1 Tax=Riccia fluitans TaxID=41844 RepID=A0ABD1YZQ6_9MARC